MRLSSRDASDRLVSLFLPTLRGGGAERAILTLAEGLLRAGRPVELVLGNRRGELEHALPPDVPVVNLGRRRLRYAVPHLASYLRERRPACMLATIDHAGVAALLASPLSGESTPVIVRVSNTMSRKAGQAESFAEKLTFKVAKRIYRRAAFVVAPSLGVAEDLVRFAGLASPAIRVIPNPVIDDTIGELAARETDHPWFGPDQPPVVMAAGRLSAQKGFEGLMHAFAQVRQALDARLVILGDGPLRSDLARTSRELGIDPYVDLPGFDANPYRYMARAGVFVLSSLYEGLPAVLIQALACGAPVVATDCASGPAEILQDGKYGQLVPVGDVDALAGAIQNTLSTRPAPPPPAAWAGFRVDGVVEQYCRLFDEVAGPTGPIKVSVPGRPGRTEAN